MNKKNTEKQVEENSFKQGEESQSEFKKWKNEKLEVWNENLSGLFDKFALLDQEDEMKADISKSVVDDADVGKLYWFQIILSALIATLGLLQNSVAVVIGAMLIAPLFIPLQALAFAITEGKRALFWRACWLIVASTVVSVFVAYVVVMLVPLQVETTEITSRVSPNIYDLFIAGFSAVIALLALVYKRLSQSVAGVAMAAALMPPLAVIGIQIGFENAEKAIGAMLLYSTNIVAIVLVGVFMFLLYGFNPHKDKAYSVIAQGLFLLIVTVGLSVPLVTSIQAEQERANLYVEVENSLELAMSEVIPEGELSDLEVSKNSDGVLVGVDLRLPEEVDLFEGDLQNFTSKVSEYLEQEVELNLDIIRTASLTEKIDNAVLVRGDILDFVTNRFRNNYNGKSIINLELEEFEDSYLLELIYIFEEEDLNEDMKRAFVRDINADFEKEIEVKWLVLNSENEEESFQNESDAVKNAFVIFLESELPSSWYFVGSSVDRKRLAGEVVYDVNLLLSLPESLRNDQGEVNSLVEFRIEQLFDEYKEKLPDLNLTVSYEVFFRSEAVRIGEE